MIKPKECQKKMGGEKRGFSPPSASPCPLGFIVLGSFSPKPLGVCVGGMRLAWGSPTWHAVGTRKVRPGGEERELQERFFLHTPIIPPPRFSFPSLVYPAWMSSSYGGR